MPNKTLPPLPVLLNDLPTPQIVIEENDDFCRRYGRTGLSKKDSLDEGKLQYYFGGLFVVATGSRKYGYRILAAGKPGNPEFDAHAREMINQQPEGLVVLTPGRWDEPEGEEPVASPPS